jgi:Ni/Co efflux regulator RcnB
MRVIVICLVTLLWGCSTTGPYSSGNYPRPTAMTGTSSAGVEVVFTEDEIRIIRAYYATNDGRSGKHKNKGKRLPPGIAKNLRRGKPLPPGIAKQSLPHDLRRQLPAPPDGYERIIVGGKLLLVELGTQIVHDILMDIAFG